MFLWAAGQNLGKKPQAMGRGRAIFHLDPYILGNWVAGKGKREREGGSSGKIQTQSQVPLFVTALLRPCPDSLPAYRLVLAYRLDLATLRHQRTRAQGKGKSEKIQKVLPLPSWAGLSLDLGGLTEGCKL